eukprot:scaffold23924_cov74-Phaeocystis_antarctica.AAC.7
MSAREENGPDAFAAYSLAELKPANANVQWVRVACVGPWFGIKLKADQFRITASTDFREHQEALSAARNCVDSAPFECAEAIHVASIDGHASCLALPRWLAQLCSVRGCLPRCAAEHASPCASELRASLLQAPERAQRALQQHVAEQLVRQVEEGHDAESVVLQGSSTAARSSTHAPCWPHAPSW